MRRMQGFLRDIFCDKLCPSRCPHSRSDSSVGLDGPVCGPMKCVIFPLTSVMTQGKFHRENDCSWSHRHLAPTFL